MIAYRRFYLFCLISLCFGSAAHGAEWKPHRYSADGFRVEFSDQISMNETKMNEETRKLVVRTTQYVQDSGSYAYIVTAGLFKSARNLGEIDSGHARECNKWEEVRLSLPGADQSREFVGKGCREVARRLVRYVIKGAWFYQVLAVFPDDGDADAARHFVNSFALL